MTGDRSNAANGPGNGTNGGRHIPRFTLDQGPIDEVHAFWLAGMSCDGCSIAAVGAQNPSVEQLVNGNIPGLPRVILHHPVLSVTAGKEFMRAYELARDGKLGAPYVVCYEGSVADETIAADCGGYWSAMGAEVGADGGQRPIPTAEWLRKLAPGAAAVIAVGTCATWGGIPAAAGNVTGSMSVMDLLGKDYLSALGLPPINVPGCSPIGDNITETITAILMFLAGVGPLPEFDELGRPAWMFGTTVHHTCVRAGNYEEGVFAKEYGKKECLVELGCWGPIVQCNITARGALSHNGGCMNAGGVCIGCTMPGFPDAFAPFYESPPGTMLSGTASRTTGSFMRPLRRISQRNRNRTPMWWDGDVPSGWGDVGKPGLVDRTVNFFYKKIQYYNSSFSPNSDRQRALQASAHSYIGHNGAAPADLPEAAE
jgi:hydrogenase small subunit